MPEDTYLGPSSEGSVMLDIGGNNGALIIVTAPERAGHEIEICRTGLGARRTHVAVRERRSPGGSRYAAIYPSLPSGEYTVWHADGRPADTVTILGGEVTQLNWT